MAYRTKADSDVDRLQPPQSLDAEQAVLGAALKDADVISDVVEVLSDGSFFYSPRHQHIYRAILDLYAASEPCDITTVANRLTADGVLEKTGGRVYLVDLVEGVPSVANVKSYVDIVQEKALLRRLIHTSNEISKSCYSLDQSIDDLLDMAEQNIFSISEYRLRKGFTPLKDLVRPTIEEVERFAETGAGFGVRTGFLDLDTLTNGLQKGDFIVVAGRPSMGKTAFAINVAEYAAIELKLAVGVFSIEMSKEALALRMLSSRAQVDQQRIRAGKLKDADWNAIAMAGGTLSEARIFIDDSPGLSLLEMRAKARRLKVQQDLSLLVVDYIQMMHASGKHENRQSEMAMISRGIKGMAKELNLPVLAVSQLSRMVEHRGGEKRPQLSDLRESGAIEQDADVVAFVYRPEFYLSEEEKADERNKDKLGVAEIIVAKQRNGPTGSIKLAFLKETARFANLSYEYRELPAGTEPVDGGEVPF